MSIGHQAQNQFLAAWASISTALNALPASYAPTHAETMAQNGF